MALWTVYNTHPETYREGAIVVAPDGGIISRAAQNAVRAGCLMIRGTDAETQAAHPAALPAADADALVTAAVCISNVAGLQLDTIAEFDGVGDGGGMTRINPPRNITMTFDAAADWDVPVGGGLLVDIYGQDANGDPLHDQLFKPNGSGATAYATVHCFSWVRRIDVQASNANAGTATIGTGQVVQYGKLDALGLAVYDRCAVPATTANYDFEDDAPISILREGEIGALPEDAVTVGEPVYVRVVAGAGALIRGRFTGMAQADDANFARLLGAEWVSASAGGTVAARMRVIL